MGKHSGKKKKNKSSIAERVEERDTEDKSVLDEKKTVKLVFGEDIRLAQLPPHCSLLQLQEVIHDRFPKSQAFLIKYRDKEGDLVTITNNEDLRRAEESAESHFSMKIYVFEVNHDKEVREEFIDEWMLDFAELFKDHVGFNDSTTFLNLHEAMEETVTSEEAQTLFNAVSEKFQEMAALALFNCGNAHMSRASMRVRFNEDGAKEEYNKAGMRYEEALRIKPDFYEGLLALGQQQFELAKLETLSSEDVLQHYNKAEENMDRGLQMWESEPKISSSYSQGVDMRSQINLLWGTILYERSIIEFKLGLPVWKKSLEVAVEKFELAGASCTDIAAMVMNHCSNESAKEGLHVSNEMYDAKQWPRRILSFRLQSLLHKTGVLDSNFISYYHIK